MEWERRVPSLRRVTLAEPGLAAFAVRVAFLTLSRQACITPSTPRRWSADRRTGKCKGTPMTLPTWKERAARARQEGYLPGGGWERMLERNLRRTRPNLVAELEQEQSLAEYLPVMTHKHLWHEACFVPKGTGRENFERIAENLKKEQGTTF